MIDCNCGEWNKEGYCVKCGEHFTDRWDKNLEEIQRLKDELEHKQKIIDSDCERDGCDEEHC